MIFTGTAIYLNSKKTKSCHWTFNKIETSNYYLLRIIYDSLFNSHLIYACEIYWVQKQKNTLFQRISRLQEKALRIIRLFERHDTPSDPPFKENKILRIKKHPTIFIFLSMSGEMQVNIGTIWNVKHIVKHPLW